MPKFKEPPEQEFVREAIKHIRQRLLAAGFRQEKCDIFSIPVSSDVVGWLGLNKATTWGLEINPVVGARHQKLERIVAECTESRFDSVIPPTVATNVGYLAPQQKYLSFIFSEASLVPQVAEEILESVRTYGIPFMKKCADLNFIVDFMKAARALNSSTEYRIPVGFHLLNRDSEAVVYSQNRLDQIAGQTNPYAEYYRKFCENLKRRLSTTD